MVYYISKLAVVVIATVSLLISGCVTKAVPDGQLKIDPAFLAIFNAIIQKDTFSFSNAAGKQKYFVITKVDSEVYNKKTFFINLAPDKFVYMNFIEIGSDTNKANTKNKIYVNRNPGFKTNTISIDFGNFHYSFRDVLPTLHHDALYINGHKINNYYLFVARDSVRYANDVEDLYISPTEGFLAFKTLSGEYWVRSK